MIIGKIKTIFNKFKDKFNPKEKQNLILPPGDYSYRASAPNVIPSVGVKNFKFNGAYKWTFYIVTRRR